MVNLSHGALRRSRFDRKLGGVAAGTAEYLDVSPTLMRFAWLAAAPFTGGLALLAYLALWAFLPEGEPSPDDAFASAGQDGRSHTAGLVLLILGILVLTSQLPGFHLAHFVWPLALVGFGLILFLRRD